MTLFLLILNFLSSLFSLDPLITSLTQDILRELTSTSGSRNQIQARLLPTIISILKSTPDKVPMGLQSVSLELNQCTECLTK